MEPQTATFQEAHLGDRPIRDLGLTKEAEGFIAVRERMGPPLRLGVLDAAINGKFANKDVLLEGLRKAGVPE